MFPLALAAASSNDSLHPTTFRWVRAMTVQPSPARLAVMDQFVRSTADILAKKDLVYILAAHDEQAMRIDVVNPTRPLLTDNGNVTFTLDRGVRGDGLAGSFYDTGFTPDGSGNMQLNAAELDVFVLSNEFRSNITSPIEFGNSHNQIRALETTLVSGTPTTVAGRIMRDATNRSGNGVVTTAVGMTTSSRSGISQSRLYKNAGPQIGSGGGAPTGFGTGPMHICEATGSTPSIRLIGACSAGALLTSDERLRWYNALVKLLTAIGAYDPSLAEGPPYEPPPDDPYAPPPSVTWNELHRGTALDMTGLSLTFDSTFDDAAALATITVDGGAGPWFAPIHAKVGKAEFRPPDYVPSPFAIVDGVLRIRCELADGVWQTGHMQSSDSAGNGFAQQRGYFEIKCRMPLPGTKGAWPAFWLYSRALYTQSSQTRAEIDIIEYYPGNDPRGHHSSVHLRPGVPYVDGEVSQHWSDSDYTTVDSLADGNWHTYGCEVTASDIIIYYDRVELKRIPMVDEFDTPMYLLVSLQMLSDEWQQAISPFDFWVEYVRVWTR